MKGVLSYIKVNMGCAKCMMCHTSAVNSNVNNYRNAPDNLNCMWLIHLIYLCQLCDMLYNCCKWESRQPVGCPR
jgi:hypothetical protein